MRAYRRLEALQGSCIPVLIGAGTIEGGRTAFIAMSDAGIQLTTLEQQCDPLLQTEALTPEVQPLHIVQSAVLRQEQCTWIGASSAAG